MLKETIKASKSHAFSFPVTSVLGSSLQLNASIHHKAIASNRLMVPHHKNCAKAAEKFSGYHKQKAHSVQ